MKICSTWANHDFSFPIQRSPQQLIGRTSEIHVINNIINIGDQILVADIRQLPESGRKLLGRAMMLHI